jgi:NAD(P)-dependent dehydrogenase (short-subunit alcohol dehydrogenase family)
MSTSKSTILITGASAGIGRATVQYFAERGWNVAATLRSPEKETELQKLPGVKLFKLDVTDSESIRAAIAEVVRTFGGLDVVVNNAGYGAVGIFEKATPEQVQKQFDTNVFGVMNVIREALPHFRSKRKGMFINISSMGGRITFPLYSLYHGTKWALEGFSEALQFELRPLGIRVKLVEPGSIKTEFVNRGQDFFKKDGLGEYDQYEQVTYYNTQTAGNNAPGPEVIAKTIWKAANSRSHKLRYPGGAQSKMLLFVRWLLPLSWFLGIVRSVVEKGFKG